MPVHDWTSVRPGTFHHFHTAWITHLSDTLNGGLLPSADDALAEQPAGQTWPDGLALEVGTGPEPEQLDTGGGPGLTAVVPLEPTYLAAWHGMPERWHRVIEHR